MLRPLPLALALGFLLWTAPLAAQQRPTPPADAYRTELALIESVLGTAVKVLQEATLQQENPSIGERLRAMALRLNHLMPPAVPEPAPFAPALAPSPASTAAGQADDLQELRRLLQELHAEMVDLRRALEAEQSYSLANRLAPVERGLAEAAGIAGRLEQGEAEPPATRGEVARREAAPPEREREGWLRPGRYDGETFEPLEDEDAAEEAVRPARRARAAAEAARREAREARREAQREAEEARRHADRTRDRDHDERHWTDREADEAREERRSARRRYRPGRPSFSQTGTFIGEFPHRWPFQETALYRPIPAIRYNRVEGFVLGAGMRPLAWDDYERGRLYGQVGYAFALDRWRYEVGVETRPGRMRDDDYALKLGALYRRNTTTNDLWKSNWIENSLAAFLFENDFFDYHEVEGWTLYAVQRLTPYMQVSAGYRTEDHRSLMRTTSWSLFDGGGFRYNPPADEGEMRSFVFAFEGGRVADLFDLPRGGAFRAEAELGQGLGGDFGFNRYEGDARLYLPLSAHTSLGLRLRGGLATGAPPLQKLFSLGGVGSVRAYPQNAFLGTRMLLANAEYIVGDVSLFDDLFEDLQLFGFADGGWIGGDGATAFRFDEVLPAAGFGLGLDDRTLRLELAWPLRDFGGGYSPALWLRVSPTF